MSRARDLANQADGTISGALTTDGLTVDTNTLAVDASNNRVGIGTSTPADQLELLAGSERLMIGANNPSTFSRVAARNTGDSGYRGLKIDGSDLHLNTESGSGNIIMSTGSDKVGIGTATPAKKLDISGDSGDVVQAKVTYAGADGNRAGFILANTHTGGREYGIYAGNDSTGGGLGNSFGISDNTASTAYRLVIDSSGKVGIGTTSPSRNFHVKETTTGGTVAKFENTAGTVFIELNTNNQVGADAGYIAYDSNQDLSFWPSDNQAMTLKADGKVGIGITNPEYPTHIEGSNVSSGGGLATLCVNDTGTAYNATNPGGGITFRGVINSSSGTTNFATVQGIKENATDGNYDTALRFTTRSNGGNLTEKMRIDSAGNVTTPNQPGCSVYNMGFSGSASSWSSAGTGSVNGAIYSTNLHHNNGNHYDTSTGYFTAPVAGYYLCNLNVYGKKDNNQGDSNGYWWGYFQKNGGYYYGNYIMEAYYNSGDYDQGASISAIIYLAANDTVRPYCGAYAHGVQVYGPNTGFSCHLLG